MKARLLILSIAVLCLSAAPALALTVTAGGPPFDVPYASSLQEVLDDITSPYPGISSVDVTTDFIPDSLDSFWDITATGGSVNTVIIELAAFKDNNLFGVYDSADHTNTVQIFGGSDNAGAMKLLAITGTGDVYVGGVDTGTDFASPYFGYYQDSTYYATGGIWYSDTSKNSDNYDHMYAYQGTGDMVKIDPWAAGTWTPNEYVIAFEDLDGSVSDWDYTDMVVMVESVVPIPVPAAVILGILGIGVAGLKLRKYA